jgi:hypothetical protein
VWTADKDLRATPQLTGYLHSRPDRQKGESIIPMAKIDAVYDGALQAKMTVAFDFGTTNTPSDAQMNLINRDDYSLHVNA